MTKKKIVYRGETLSEERLIYNTFHLTEKIAADGVITYFEYDGAGRKIKETTLERETLYSYDHLGRVERIAKTVDDKQIQVLQKKYDLLDRVVEEQELDGNGKLFGYTVYQYDNYSNKKTIAKEVHIGKAVEFFEYDSFRRVTLHRDPLGNETITTYDDHFRNQWGQTVIQKTIQDPNGNKTIEMLDTLGNVSTIEKLGQDGHILLRENFYYDRNGNKIKQVSELLNSDKTIIKTWDYDCRGRLTKLNEADSKTTFFEYSPDGHLIEVTKPDGMRVTYTYNGLGQKIEAKTSDESCHYSFTYDRLGHVIESMDQGTGKKISRNINHFGELLTETFPNGYVMQNQYDHLGRRIALTLPDQTQIHYQYDSYHLKSVKRFDRNGSCTFEHYYSI